jgi:hypothetical protein
VAATTRCARASGALRSVVGAGETEGFADALTSVKLDAASVSVAVIAGSDDGRETGPEDIIEAACSDAEGDAVYPATRLIALVDSLHPRSIFEPACAASYGVSIAHIARLAEPSSFIVCARHEVLGSPLSVHALSDDSRTEITTGVDGYVFLGVTESCANGAVAISQDWLDSGATSVEIRYCAP